eukprot:7882839-Karenia_brevis.AAC.1
MADKEVSEDIHETIYGEGFIKLSTFLGLGETRVDARETLKDDFGIDSSESLALRVQVARVFATCAAASVR